MSGRRSGNKSHKVPNVRLRPRIVQEPLAAESQAGSDDTSIMDSCPRPFKGVLICATGVADKHGIHQRAALLGAAFSNDFLNTVTHLIAGGYDSPKYKACSFTCALERKVPILKASWIDECHRVWLRGDDVDIASMVEAHRFPPFTSVILSVSGITDILRRTKINQKLREMGGTYVKDLERPVRVTHLLCSGEEVTDKMRYARKFNERGEANIKLVWEDWFWDCVSYGGRFDEAGYRVDGPRPKPKTIAVYEEAKENEATTQPPSSADPSPSKTPLPSQHDDDLDEPVAVVNRTPAITLKVWNSLLKPRGYQQIGDRLVPPPEPNDIPMDVQEAPQPTPKEALFKRVNSSTPVASTSQVPFVAKEKTVPEPFTVTQRIFTAMRFRVLGEAKSQTVQSAVEACGGVVVSDADVDIDYIIVRLVSGSKFFRDEGNVVEKAKYRTECWLERCVFEERICEASEHVTFLPLDLETPLLAAETVTLSFSGLDSSEACWVRRLIRVLGLVHAPNFSRKSTHLLCPSGTGAKAVKAQEWNIPVVGMDWVENLVQTGVVPSLVAVVDRNDSAGDAVQIDETDILMPPRVDKGKGKAVEVVTGIDNGKGKARMVDKAQVSPWADKRKGKAVVSPRVDKGKAKAAVDHTVSDSMAEITNLDNILGDLSVAPPRIARPPPQDSFEPNGLLGRSNTHYSFEPNEPPSNNLFEPTDALKPMDTLEPDDTRGHREGSITSPIEVQVSFADDDSVTTPRDNDRESRTPAVPDNVQGIPTQSTEQNVEERVPSSASPSPMKLQHLLGKRGSTESAGGGGGSKRVRREVMVRPVVPSVDASTSLPNGGYIESPSMFNETSLGAQTDMVVSPVVRYEDAREGEERRALLRLFPGAPSAKSAAAAFVSKGGKAQAKKTPGANGSGTGRRRSARVPGF